MMTLAIEYADGSPSETVAIERLDARYPHVLAYVLPGENVAHAIPIARIERYVLTRPAPVNVDASQSLRPAMAASEPRHQ